MCLIIKQGMKCGLISTSWDSTPLHGTMCSDNYIVIHVSTIRALSLDYFTHSDKFTVISGEIANQGRFRKSSLISKAM